MSDLRFIAISSELADEVRKTLLSPGYGHPVTEKIASGLGPCRHCLQPFAIGEDVRLLFTLNPFDGVASIPQPGPVFLHARDCDRHVEEDAYPPGLVQLGALLEGYGEDQLVLRREVVDAGISPEPSIQGMFEEPAVRYVMIRDPNAGCYRMRVQREEKRWSSHG